MQKEHIKACFWKPCIVYICEIYINLNAKIGELVVWCTVHLYCSVTANCSVIAN